MSAIPPIHSASGGMPPAVGATQPRLKSDGAEEGSGQNVFVDLLSQVNRDQVQTEQAIQGLVSGETQDVQQVVMEVVKAEMSFQVFMEVRNQIIESYNELMRMQF
ncbi:MAG: flagellar hook-basal body complex protein FliE [Planctomycetota bacterium]